MGNACSARVNEEKNEDRLPSKWKSNHEVMDMLGSGMSGKVWRVRDENEKEFAMKVMPLLPELAPDEIDDMRRECRLLKEVNHHGILKYYDHIEDLNSIYLKTEILRGRELFEYVTSQSEYSENDARIFVRKFFSTLAYLHDRNIVHRDLKPENIILGEEKDLSSVKLVDFGLATKLGDPERGITKAAGTPGYLAPECLMRNPNYGIPSDAWAAGVITYIMLCGYPPFYGDSDVELFREIRSGRLIFDEDDWANISEHAKDFVRKLLTKDPKKRITIEASLKHPWLTSADEEFKNNNMKKVIDKMKTHMAKIRFKKSVKAVIFMRR